MSRPTETTTADETTRAHVYAWAKAVGLDHWLTTADYDDLARRLASETRTEWTWRHNAFVSTANATTDRAQAERSVERCRAANPGDPVTLVCRTVTAWVPVGGEAVTTDLGPAATPRPVQSPEARKHIAALMAALARDIDTSTLRGHFHNRGYPHLDDAALTALRWLISTAAVAVTWPDHDTTTAPYTPPHRPSFPPVLGSPCRAQGDRTRIEEAIEKRLREAWPNWPIDEVWLEQVAAQASLAVVDELDGAACPISSP